MSGKRVLVCVDSSPIAQKAFEYYCNSIHLPENKVIVLHVSQAVQVHLPAMGSAIIPDPIQIDREVAEIRQQNKELKTFYLQLCKDANIEAEFDCINGQDGVGRSIVEYIKDKQISFTVVGSRGLGLLKRTVLGSTSDYILHHSHTPVLIFYPTD